MRQYKAKRIDNGEWVKGCLYQVNNVAYILLAFPTEKYGCGYSMTNGKSLKINTAFRVDPSTVCASTGLTDKAFWEDDICEAEYRCAVCFDSEPHILTGTIERADNGLWMFDYGHGSMPLDSEDLEITKVIGNKWDNPELIEGKG